MKRSREFSHATKELALVRQKKQCASCGTSIFLLGDKGRAEHRYGEGARAHHMRHVKFGGSDSADNCVILYESCHYSAHEGGSYRKGKIIARDIDFPYYIG